MSAVLGTPKRRLSKDDKDLLKFVTQLNSEVQNDEEPKPEEVEQNEDSSSSSEEEEEHPPPPPKPEEMDSSVNKIASQLDDDWEVMAKPSSVPSSVSASEPEPNSGLAPGSIPSPTGDKVLDFDTIMKNAALTRRGSYSERNQAEELVHSMRETLHMEETVEQLQTIPPPAVRRALVSRKFDHLSPNFIGLKCWADRWMVVENDELKYYLKQSDEEEGKLPTSTMKLSGCKAILGTGPSVPKIGEYGDENYMPAIESNGLEKDMFKVMTSEGPITHKSLTDEHDARAWVRLFNYSPALKSPTLKETKRIRASFTSNQNNGSNQNPIENMEELNLIAEEENARLAAVAAATNDVASE
mmetsp:Transcript_22824/g.26846  ORF Transcript_22824/g.26846 Transcript_22824/m.26846 type:complete len:356 (-) Transcript_22824:135-1202(-)